jgi:predicted MFS family arabinose efflux permease
VDRTLTYPRLRRAAFGTALVFFVSGSLLGTWVSRLPATRDRLHASPAELGLALLAPGIGALISMPTAGWLCRRFGSRTVVAATALPCMAFLVLLAVVPSLPTVAAALLLWGLVYGTWDVAMNVQGSGVENRAGKAWMPRYHACWSVGGIAGAALGAVAARAGTSLVVHFGVIAAVAAILLVAGLSAFAADIAEPAAAGGDGHGWAALLTPRLIAIGCITLCSVIIEGAAADWLALYLVDDRHVTQSVGAAGYSAFAAAMAVGRFAGTPITARLGRAGAARIGGLTAVAGVLLTVLGPWLALAYLGMGLWAVGICLIFPATISAAGESPRRPADAIAVVSSIGYGGLLVGPPLIGFLAEHVGLGNALLALLVLAATISLLAPALASRRTVTFGDVRAGH